MGSSDDGALVDEEAIGAELAEIEDALSDKVRDDCSDDELRELLEGVRREKEAFQKAMDLDSAGMFQDDDEE